MKVIRNIDDVPAWDCACIHSYDFRPHFDGHLVNVASCILPQGTRDETTNLYQECARVMAAWILENRKDFGPNDRFQLILGWPVSIRATGRQVIKTGGTFDQIQSIADGTSAIPFMPGWDKGIFKNSTEQEAGPYGSPAAGSPSGQP